MNNHQHHILLLQAGAAPSIPAWLFDSTANLEFDFINDRHWLNATEYGAASYPGTVTRASDAWAFGTDISLDEFASGAERVNDRGLTVEGARTNLIPYPDMTGATTGTIGSGGALPTSWTQTFTTNGGDVDVTAGSTVDGMPYIDVRFYGTTSGTSRIRFGANGGITGLSAATAYAGSLFCAHTAGTLPGISLNILWFNSGLGSTGSTSLSLQPSSSLWRHLIPGTSPASTERAHLEVSRAAGTFDFTLRFAAPQFEAGTEASTPIVHGSTSGTRAADIIAADVTGDLDDDQTWLIEWAGLIGPLASKRVILDLNDGSTDNQVQLYVDTDDHIKLSFRSGASDGATWDMGAAVPAGQRIALAWDQSTGAVRASLNGGTSISNTGHTIPTGATFTDLSIGSDVAGANPINGRVLHVGQLDAYSTTTALEAFAVAAFDEEGHIFDGTFTYQRRSSGLSGASDSKTTLVFASMLKVNAGTSTESIFTAGQTKAASSLSNIFAYSHVNTTPATEIEIYSDFGGNMNDAQRYHWLVGCDTDGQKRAYYWRASTGTWTAASSGTGAGAGGTLDWTWTQFTLGASDFLANKFNSRLYRVAIWAGISVPDVSQSSVQNLFTDGANLVDPWLSRNAYGIPLVDWYGDFEVVGRGINNGSGGDLDTVAGAMRPAG